MARRHAMNPLSGFAVDFGGTKIAAARIEGGLLVDRTQCATDANASMEDHIDTMEALLRSLGYARNAPLGVAVTGRIGRDGMWRAVNRGTLTAVTGVPLAKSLDERFGAARAVNDASAAAWAESLVGAGRGASNFLYVTVSTGVGGGIVLNGKLLESENGLAGHIGFMSSGLAHELCGSGRYGTVESVAAGRALAAASARAGKPDMDARAVFAAAQAGDAWALALVDRSAQTVACMIADLTTALGIDTVAVGGSIGLADGYLERVRCFLCREPELFSPNVVHAALGQDSALIGALSLAQASQVRQELLK